MADYGVDLDGILDWPDPEVLVSGPENLGRALARMLLTTNGALLDVGDEDPCETLNLRDWLGARPTDSDVRGLNNDMMRILEQAERVETVTASATFTNGDLSVAVSGIGAAGPFSLILSIGAVTGARLQVLQ